MGLLLTRIAQNFAHELRSSLENPSTPISYPAEWLLDIFNGGRTDSGLRVSEMTAMQVSTVLACLNIIGNGVASSPLLVMEKFVIKNRLAKRVAHDHPLFDLLHTEPNVEMTSPTFLKTLMVHALLWGNGYSEIQRSKKDASIIALWPRNPARTRPVRLLKPAEIEGDMLPTGTLIYETTESIGDSQITFSDTEDSQIGVKRYILMEDMIHLPGLSLDGRLGQGTVYLARQVIGLALATEKYGAKFFGNGARPGGVLELPGTMTPIALENLKRSFAESHGGENAWKTAVLEAGVKYVKTGATPNEGQFLETRLYQQNDIARVFGVPVHMVGDPGKSSGRSTVEQSAIEFVLFCLNPWLHQLEKELKRKLFSNLGRNASKYFVKFDTRRMMYPDADSRSKFYTSGKQWGYLNTNDIRELEDMNPVDDPSGETYWIPINMQDASMAATHSAQVQDGLDKGTLAATPSNVTPIADHPVVQEAKKQDKADKAHEMQKHEISSKASVAIAKHQGAAADSGQGGAGKGATASPAGKKAAAKRMFIGMMRDAVGRASTRKKPTAGDYITIFGPLAMTLAETLNDEPVDQTAVINGFLSDLFAGRAEGWGDNLDTAAALELEKMVDKLQIVTHSESMEAVS